MTTPCRVLEWKKRSPLINAIDTVHCALTWQLPRWIDPRGKAWRDRPLVWRVLDHVHYGFVSIPRWLGWPVITASVLLALGIIILWRVTHFVVSEITFIFGVAFGASMIMGAIELFVEAGKKE